MSPIQKRYVFILLILNIIFFLIFIPSNSAASEDIEMIGIFEPDEAVPLPYVFNMIRPETNLKNALINFAFYKYYFYGFPYFAYSALLLLPLSIAGRLAELPLVMLILRQMVSVLPLLLVIDLLVFMQTRFKDYRSVILFILLVSIPAVFKNNLWWHPDGLAILFNMLAIFFLHKDNLQFKRGFYLAAAMCGISAGTKGICFYLFLTIFVYLLMGYFTRKIPIRKLILSATCLIAVMAASYLLVNPTLIYASVRRDYFKVMGEQVQFLSQGYDIAYPKGLKVVIPQLKVDYASIPFLATLFYLNIQGMLKGKKRLLNIIIFTWAIPLTIQICFLIHYKFQYWLPVALPLFSTVANLLPEKIEKKKVKKMPKTILLVAIFCGGFLLYQIAANIQQDIQIYKKELTREESSSAIQFYESVVEELSPLPEDKYIHIMSDVRMYLPAQDSWDIESVFELPDYAFLAEKDFDILMILQQRIYDYLGGDAVGLDEDSFAEKQDFYRDARNGSINGYELLYSNDFGLVFLEENLYQQYY